MRIKCLCTYLTGRVQFGDLGRDGRIILKSTVRNKKFVWHPAAYSSYHISWKSVNLSTNLKTRMQHGILVHIRSALKNENYAIHYYSCCVGSEILKKHKERYDIHLFLSSVFSSTFVYCLKLWVHCFSAHNSQDGKMEETKILIYLFRSLNIYLSWVLFTQACARLRRGFCGIRSLNLFTEIGKF
jgi:hypothetical protein